MQIINWTSVNISFRVIIYTAVLKPRSHQLKHLSYHTVLDAGGFFHHILERERVGGRRESSTFSASFLSFV